jgi:zinc metalloprotease ZmpA
LTESKGYLPYHFFLRRDEMKQAIVFVLAIFLSSIALAQENTAPAEALDIAESFINDHAPVQPSGNSLQIEQSFADTLGQAHVKYQHFYNGIPVFESEAIVHIDLATETVIGFTDALLPFAAIDTQPGIGSAEAHGKALQHFQLSRGLNHQDDLMVLVKDDVASLAWRIHLVGEGAHGPIDKIAFIGAQKGDVLRAWDNVETTDTSSNDWGYFDGKVALTTDPTSTGYRLRDPSRGNQLTCDMKNRQANCYYMDDSDDIWGDGTLANRQTVAVDAQYGTAETWDYYKNVHLRNGIANDSKGAYNRVHYGKNYNNAFWSDSCFCMTYGDGDGTTFNPFDSLDVAGHEMSHGVTSRTANLTYSGESGGLNEGTSDIFGTMVEFYANNANDVPDYLIGEKLYKSGTKALRSMIQPSLDGKSSDCWYSGLGSLDVHYSSGVANHFYYLLAEGTPSSSGITSKTCNTSDTRVAIGAATLVGITRSKAEKIWYRALTVYMTASTTYAGARTATLNAATDIYGAGSAEASAVAAAWAAVNVK